ncbi:DUF4283 domain protein, partial [Trifolium medium]|nr:DUF4283 domain protein [Trifolium medium]
MASSMNTASASRTTQATNNHHVASEGTNQRPSKVPKLSIPQPNLCIQIPEFMGPNPTFNHHEENQYFQYNSSKLQQEEVIHQDQANIRQENHRPQSSHPRNTAEASFTNAMPQSPGDGPFCMYKEAHIKEGIQQCKNSLIGKLFSNKPIIKPIIQNTLMGIWGNPKGFTITEIEGGLYHLTMDQDKDIQRAVKGNPWIIRNSWFMVHLWDRKLNPTNIEFNFVPIWIQLWGLPIHCKTITMGKHLGSQLGKVEDAALYDYPQQARIVKIKVLLNIEEPIRPGMFIGNPKDGITWVDFRYENMPMFCFDCGLVGHNEDNCISPTQAQPEGYVNPRGPWLRSNIYGKRVNDKRDKRFNSNPMQSMSGGQFSPIPKAMLEMLAKMKIEEENEA